ncbi:hypothetical protein SASPL_155092 [Salvia splendens]|uniref:Uncharacterized protein n=1 Tax=Salvia splendens TaxID=180675 RepID=A0A8X8YZB5_SALSN|nr:hypothetical protein SASPL_155092 [Salvia splendens]
MPFRQQAFVEMRERTYHIVSDYAQFPDWNQRQKERLLGLEAVDRMLTESAMKGVEFWIVNSDIQASMLFMMVQMPCCEIRNEFPRTYSRGRAVQVQEGVTALREKVATLIIIPG